MNSARCALVCLVGAVSLAGAGEADGPTEFKITTKQKDDAVEVRSEKGRTEFIVKNPCGISQALAERTQEKWPEVVMLRLPLKGLESFRAANGKVTLDAAVSSQGGKVRLWKDGKEDAPLDEKSPFWVDIHLVGGDGKPAK